MLWVALTIFGALMNAIRLGLQKHLNNDLSTAVVTWVRYSFGLPFVLLYLLFVSQIHSDIPEINNGFLLYCTLGGITQILGTMLLVTLFKHRNFAIGVTYSKTEAVQTALIGLILFQETISLIGMVAIILGVVGIVIISVGEKQIDLSQITSSASKKSALIGIGAGFSFALSGLFIRNASLALDGTSPMMQAAMTLTVTIIIQVAILGAWISYKKQQDFFAIIANIKISALIGFTSVLGSIGLFTALAMAEAAYVKTVTQVGVVFSIMITHKCFKEKVNKQEMIGIIVLIGSIGLLSFYK
ncbi:MAG: EamA family transporter [Proteobacteria bacterium]|nr:EamA family transporter [Pseudomonadota bacterium]